MTPRAIPTEPRVREFVGLRCIGASLVVGALGGRPDQCARRSASLTTEFIMVKA